ncbi:MAG: PqiC family protein [Candidatus Dactylopiibacterium sp.]|nr:PqiC family protein [Candidatus Dactylopiibacterium sp.]
MMPRTLRLSLVLIAVLAGCASAPPLRHYTLVPPDAARAPATAAPLGGLIEIASVTVPVAVDRQEIVLRDGRQGLLLLESERWSARLGDEVQAALAASLTHRLGMRNAADLPHAPDQNVLRVRVALRSLEATAGGSATLAADWSLATRGAGPVCSSRFTAPAGAGTAALVTAYQDLVERLAAALETAARAGGACPAN